MMFDKIFSVATTALIVTAVGIALRPGAPTPLVVDSLLTGFSKIQTSTFGPQ